ncbi:MAG: efflux transporter periplasmic adaptor subunit, partial [Inhella sp.]
SFDQPEQAPQVAGLYAEGRVDTGAQSALVLAEGSIQRQGDSAFVWKLQGDGLKKVAVQLGARAAPRGEVVVLSGLAAGDQVLRAPTSTLIDGQKLQRVKPGAGAASAVAQAR